MDTQKPYSSLFSQLIITCGLLLTGGALSAHTILINLGGLDATPELSGSDGSLTNWNSIVTPNDDLASVIDSNGNTLSGISVATDNFSTSSTFDNNNSSAVYGSGGSIASWLDTDAVELPWYRAGGATATIVISGLTAPSYSVDFIAARSSAGSGDERIADYQVNGVFADSTPNGDDFSSYLDGWVNGSVLTWDSVIPSSGSITLTGTGVVNAHFDAIRLVAVPEPGTVGLIIAFTGAFIVIARRRFLC